MTVIGFAAGSLPLSLWLGRLALGVDIRDFGPDRNPGAGNVWRAGGPALGIAAAVLDIAKAAVPIAVARLALGISGWALVPVALAPIVGHDFSPLLRFRGGKGVAVTFGAWYAATKTHKNWPGKMRAFLGLELMALEGAPLGSACSEELVSVLDKVAADNPELVPYGTSFYSPVYCWNDQWPFAAEGIPGIRLGTSNAMYQSLYHTNYETIDLVSYDYLAKVGKFLFRTQRSLDCGLLPYDLPARAASLAASVDGDALKAAGADCALVDDLVCRIEAFTAACDTYEAGKDCITKATKLKRANNKLLKIVRMVHDDFIALSAWDYTIYPHEQVFWDLELLNAAIAELEMDPVDPDAAAGPIWDISQMYYGLMFSYDAFVDDQQRHDPSYYRIAWGGQGQLAPYHDLVAEYDQIYAGDYAGAKASLTEVRDAQVVLLDERLAQMVKTLKKVTPKVRALLY